VGEREEAAAEVGEGYLYRPRQNPGGSWPLDPDADGRDRDADRASTWPGRTAIPGR
jgi:hypothetical protein